MFSEDLSNIESPNQPKWRLVFSYKPFAKFWAASFTYNIFYWMLQLPIPFLVYSMTKSNTWVGVVAFAQLIPLLFLTPAAGVLADRSNCRKVVVITVLIQFIACAMFAVLWAIGELTPARILMISIIIGINDGLQITSWQSLVPKLVPPEYLADALRLYYTQSSAALALGPMLAAVLLALPFGSFGTVFFAATGIFLALIAIMHRISPDMPEPLGKDLTVFRGFAEGIAYVVSQRSLVVAMGAGFFIAFCGWAMVDVAAGLATEYYKTGEVGLGWFITSVGAGAIAGSVSIALFGSRYQRSTRLTTGFGLYALGLCSVAVVVNYWLGFVGFFVMGFAHMVINITAYTYLQVNVLERFRGRMTSIYLMSVYTGIPVGALTAGLFGDLVGLKNVYFVASAVMAVIALSGRVYPRMVRRINMKPANWRYPWVVATYSFLPLLPSRRLSNY